MTLAPHHDKLAAKSMQAHTCGPFFAAQPSPYSHRPGLRGAPKRSGRPPCSAGLGSRGVREMLAVSRQHGPKQAHCRPRLTPPDDCPRGILRRVTPLQSEVPQDRENRFHGKRARKHCELVLRQDRNSLKPRISTEMYNWRQNRREREVWERAVTGKSFHGPIAAARDIFGRQPGEEGDTSSSWLLFWRR